MANVDIDLGKYSLGWSDPEQWAYGQRQVDACHMYRCAMLQIEHFNNGFCQSRSQAIEGEETGGKETSSNCSQGERRG